MSGYGGFKAIVAEAKQLEEQVKSEPEVACPVCGTVLDVNPRGAVNCPMGHYRAPTNVKGR